jgi:hypothetical protein
MNAPRQIALIAAAAVAAAASSFLFAQTPAAATADMPKPKCEAPGDYPSKLSSDNQRRMWGKSRDNYLECMKKFISEQQAAAEPHIKAGNAAIADYNAAIKRFNEQMEAPQ